jgi:hypothetical protein
LNVDLIENTATINANDIYNSYNEDVGNTTTGCGNTCQVVQPFLEGQVACTNDSIGAPCEIYSDAGLAELIKGFDLQDGIENALLAKLERNDNSANAEDYHNLIQYIDAQRGNKISEEEADLLLEYIENLIDQL